MSNIKICSFNVRGLNETKKRRDVFDWLQKKGLDIYLLQETHATPSTKQIWENEWGYKCFFSCYAGNSRGTAILFKNSFQYTVHKEIYDPEGRYIILSLTINDVKLVLANIYGPNTDDPLFFNMIKTKLGEFDKDKIVIGGDFNVVQDYTLDNLNISNRNNQRSHEILTTMKDDFELYDPWRLQNPDTRMYTWHNSRNQQSRLDYFLISDDTLDFVESSLIKPGYRSDHSIVQLQLKFTDQKSGPGLWKFNNSLLNDTQYENEIKTCIQNITDQYTNANREKTIGDQLFFEILKMEIRGKTIGYTSAKKKLENIQEKELDKEIDNLHKEYTLNPTTENLNKLTSTQNDLQILREKKVEGIIVRSKARWQLEGERSSKYFCSLENRHYTEKTIKKLIDDQDQEINNIKEILDEQKRFYEKLYTTNNPTISRENENIFFPENENIQKLSELESASMENDLTVGECLNVLAKMKKNKSPGSDGFTVEFYLHFWNDLKYPMLKSFQESYEKQVLADSQKLGVITCLPKPGKPREFIKNWRPISLLNVDYKIISGVIANRIKNNLDHLISNSQKGFISGRYIGECTRLVSDLIYKMNKTKKAGIILMIDFEKAFDTLEWSFIDKTLSYFNFGTKIKKWIRIFYTDIESFIINNGHCSSRFKLSRGVRQGDPLSPYLFILAAEILTSTLCNNIDIKGISIDNTEYLISQLADDTTLFLDPDENSFKTCINIIGKFSEIAGLGINYSKTLAVKINMKNEIRYQLPNSKEIIWQTGGKFKLLGIEYDLDQENFTELNYEKKLKEFEKTLSAWQSRKITLYGKICIIKTLALSKLIHLFSALPNPPEDFFKKLDSISFSFVWNGKSERLKRTTMQNTYENGGLKMPNFRLFCMAQKMTWIKRLQNDIDFSDWKTLLLTDIEKHGSNYIWFVNHNTAKFIKDLNPFWKDVYKAWTTMLTGEHESTDMPHFQPIFHNPSIMIGQKTIFYHDWYLKGVMFINDLLNENGQLLTWEEFSNQYNIQNQAFQHYALLHAIPRNWKKRLKDTASKVTDTVPKHIKKLKLLKKPSNYFYTSALKQSVTRSQNAENKWHEILSTELDNNNWKLLYFLPHTITKDTKLKQLQFKLIHRILPTNNWLFKVKLTNTKACTFCHIYNETIEHLFWNCTITRNLWLQLSTWLKLPHPFTMQQTILGNTKEQSYIEHIKLITKEFIYTSKIEEKEPTFYKLLTIIKLKINIEKHYLRQPLFERKWTKEILNNLKL